MKIENIRTFIKEKAEQFGAKIDWTKDRQDFERRYTDKEALNDDGAFFGFIHSEEEPSGPYHDFSFVIFPSNPDEKTADDKQKPWLICLIIGTLGFKNDYELATFPGARRLFSKLTNENGYCKSDFSDIETSLPKQITGNQKLLHLKRTIGKYSKFISACQILEDPENEEGKNIISAFLAGYAKLRDWPSNKLHRKSITEALEHFTKEKNVNDFEEIKNLLRERKYIVLQGPPGTGKTRTAKAIAENLNAKTFFTQFHAETSFSDFIYGIRPDINKNELLYKPTIGSFTEALTYAIEHKSDKVILIIDEINRANLSNVLGPIFYLFEHKMDKSDIQIEIYPDLKINQLPDNFMVIATMNTADRSLAVVDFALRRRFAWYSLKPKAFDSTKFFTDDFTRVQEIFDWYASSNELSLQPGQGYFIADTEVEMKNRIKYEIYPLIKEYLQEGLIRNAKEEFNNYFITRINQSLFE